MSYQVLARRWRPMTFQAVVGQGPIVRTLQNALARERIAHAYLFAGPRGVGKTTTARLLAMGLNCDRSDPAQPVPCAVCGPCREVVAGRALDVMEIDGASNRGIDEVRALRENARYAPARSRRKVYIIDEVHMLTEPAFNALLKTLEEPPAHVVFILATTEAHRLPATILSRCQRFDFRPIGSEELTHALQGILGEEARRAEPSAGVAVEGDALRLIARAADGSLRDALSLLDTALAYGEGRVTAAAVRELLGTGGAEAAWALADALVARRAADALQQIADAAQAGLDLGALCQEAMELLRQALLLGVTGTGSPDLTTEETTRLRALGPSGAGGDAELTLLVKGLLDAEAEMRRSPHPRVDLEVAALRLCQRPQPQAIEAILARLEDAEARLSGPGGLAGVRDERTAPTQPDLLGGPSEVADAPRSGPAPVRISERPTPGAARPAPGRAIGDDPGASTVPSAGGRHAPGRVPAVGPGAPRAALPDSGSSRGRPREAADIWSQIVAEVTRVRPSLGHLLDGGVVVAEEAGRLTVAVPNGSAFTQDQLRLPANRELVVSAARRVRPEVRDVVLTTDGAGSGATEAVPDHLRVKAAVTLFDGEITAVRPTGPRTSHPGGEEEG
jgi:DNA polymerase III subunit gamma/tau